MITKLPLTPTKVFTTDACKGIMTENIESISSVRVVVEPTQCYSQVFCVPHDLSTLSTFTYLPLHPFFPSQTYTAYSPPPPVSPFQFSTYGWSVFVGNNSTDISGTAYKKGWI